MQQKNIQPEGEDPLHRVHRLQTILFIHEIRGIKDGRIFRALDPEQKNLPVFILQKT